MSDRPTGPACGNNPNYRMSDGDRQAVADFKAYLAGRAALRDRIAEALYAHDHPSHAVPLNETGMEPAYRESADAVLAVLPPPVPRADVYRELADQQEQTAATDVIRRRRSIATARRLFAVELRRMADEAQPGTEAQPAADGWRGATELIPDREVQRLAATGLVGYQQDRGRLLHCLHHKPAPASRYVDFQEVTADDLPNGGICVHPSCGADLLAVQPAADARQDGAQS
ncbi:hypothetical protein [Streptomyces luteogriseus]|uniref:hypothetical protein n=1 Tax=Streptomyces luteogriseus TaxID=68233 RepID=UPI0037F70F91